MATIYFPQQQPIVGGSFNDAQYQNLNMNQVVAVVSTDDASKGTSQSANEYSRDDSNAQINNSNGWSNKDKLLQPEASEPSALLDFIQENKQQNSSAKGNSNKKSSTLSLHIAAYENSIVKCNNGDSANEKWEPKSKKIFRLISWKDIKQYFHGKPSQKYIEFQRYQNHDEPEPETMFFKISQRLLYLERQISTSNFFPPLILITKSQNAVNDLGGDDGGADGGELKGGDDGGDAGGDDGEDTGGDDGGDTGGDDGGDTGSDDGGDTGGDDGGDAGDADGGDTGGNDGGDDGEDTGGDDGGDTGGDDGGDTGGDDGGDADGGDTGGNDGGDAGGGDISVDEADPSETGATVPDNDGSADVADPSETGATVPESDGSADVADPSETGATVPDNDGSADVADPSETGATVPDNDGSADVADPSETGATVPDNDGSADVADPSETGATVPDNDGSADVADPSETGATVPDNDGSADVEDPSETGATVPDNDGSADVEDPSETGATVPDNDGSADVADPSETGATVPDNDGSADVADPSETGATVPDNDGSADVEDPSETGATVPDNDGSADVADPSETGATVPDNDGSADVADPSETGATVPDNDGSADVADPSETGATVPDNDGSADVADPSETGATVPESDGSADVADPSETSATVPDNDGSADVADPSETGATVPDNDGSADVADPSETGATVPESDGSADVADPSETSATVPDNDGSADVADPSETGATVPDNDGSADVADPSETGATVPDNDGSADVADPSETGATVPDNDGSADVEDPSETGATVPDNDGSADVADPSETGATVPDNDGSADVADPSETGATVPDNDGSADVADPSEIDATILDNEEGAVIKDQTDANISDDDQSADLTDPTETDEIVPEDHGSVDESISSETDENIPEDDGSVDDFIPSETGATDLDNDGDIGDLKGADATNLDNDGSPDIADPSETDATTPDNDKDAGKISDNESPAVFCNPDASAASTASPPSLITAVGNAGFYKNAGGNTEFLIPGVGNNDIKIAAAKLNESRKNDGNPFENFMAGRKNPLGAPSSKMPSSYAKAESIESIILDKDGNSDVADPCETDATAPVNKGDADVADQAKTDAAIPVKSENPGYSVKSKTVHKNPVLDGVNIKAWRINIKDLFKKDTDSCKEDFMSHLNSLAFIPKTSMPLSSLSAEGETKAERVTRAVDNDNTEAFIEKMKNMIQKNTDSWNENISSRLMNLSSLPQASVSPSGDEAEIITSDNDVESKSEREIPVVADARKIDATDNDGSPIDVKSKVEAKISEENIKAWIEKMNDRIHKDTDNWKETLISHFNRYFNISTSAIPLSLSNAEKESNAKLEIPDGDSGNIKAWIDKIQKDAEKGQINLWSRLMSFEDFHKTATPPSSCAGANSIATNDVKSKAESEYSFDYINQMISRVKEEERRILESLEKDPTLSSHKSLALIRCRKLFDHFTKLKKERFPDEVEGAASTTIPPSANVKADSNISDNSEVKTKAKINNLDAQQERAMKSELLNAAHYGKWQDDTPCECPEDDWICSVQIHSSPMSASETFRHHSVNAAVHCAKCSREFNYTIEFGKDYGARCVPGKYREAKVFKERSSVLHFKTIKNAYERFDPLNYNFLFNNCQDYAMSLFNSL